MPAINPTVGRVVLFHLNGSSPPVDPPRDPFTMDESDTYAAIIAYVACPNLVNLAVFSSTGVPFGRTSIPLIQEGETPPEGAYCEWMQYQKSVASGKIPPTLHAPAPTLSSTLKRQWGESEETTHPAIANATPLDNYGAPIPGTTQEPQK